MRASSRGSFNFVFALVCFSMLGAGCSKSEQAEKAEKTEKTEKAEVTFDVGRLPRVAGAKEIYASPATTIFTSPETVTQTAETLGKTLAAGGWQQYSAPLAASSDGANQRIMSFKKGQQALGVFITVAPAQGNATSVQYTAVALKTDLPFTKDASNIEYSPDRPLLTLTTAEPIDRTLDFYRKELGARGWSLWSEKTNGKQPDGGPSGTVHERGGYAHYTTDKDPSIALVVTLQKTDAGPVKVELKQWPVGILESMHKAYLNGGTNRAKPVDVSALPRLDGAEVEAKRSSPDRLSYLVTGSLANTIAATKALLAADGWKPYAVPLDEVHERSLNLKKGTQGLSLFFTSPHGPVERTGVDYSSARLGFALPFPDDATDIVFNDNRPYLNLTTAGTVDTTREFFNTQLLASGWSPLSATAAAAKWPNAKLDEPAGNGALAYFISENQRPVVLSVQRRDDGKTNVEIKLPSFALPQALDVGEEIYGMPRPKQAPSAGGTRGATVHEMHAQVPAEVGTVLAFYRRELAARNWKEETQGAVVSPDQVVLNFTPAEGSAVLKLSHKYDMTVVSLVRQVPKPVAKVEPAGKDDSIDAMMKQAQQMARDAGVNIDIAAAMKPPRMAQAANAPAETLHAMAGSDAPVPVPEGAEDVDFADGRLEFSSAANVKSVAEFYRATMKQQGWQSQSSVINNANMVVLNFSKARQSVSFTVMRMGDKTNVTAEGSALKVAAAKSGGAAAAPADKAPVQASADDLVVEKSGGLPVPKRHTLTVGTETPFRRELNANVPLELVTVLEFYRRELGKLDWKEKGTNPAASADSAVLAYTSTEGPALLKLGRKDDETTVSLIVRNPDAAAKAGVAPKAGQAKVLISNPNEVEAVITINKRTIKAAAGVGMKGPDGPVLDLAPGKYKFSIKVAGKPTSNDEMDVGADETWGLLVGPGGALPMHVY